MLKVLILPFRWEIYSVLRHCQNCNKSFRILEGQTERRRNCKSFKKVDFHFISNLYLKEIKYSGKRKVYWDFSKILKLAELQ